MFKIGADVYTTDGQAGKLMKVVIDPDTERITHLIVEKGLFQKTDRVVPIETLGDTSDEGIRLTLSTAELEQLPHYTESQFRVPDPGWERESYQVDDPAHVLRWGIHYAPPMVDEYVLTREEEFTRGVDADQSVIGKGTVVYDREGEVGAVETLQIDETTNQVTHLVVKSGLLDPQFVIPMSAVTSISDTGVNIDLTREQLTALSPTEPDAG